MESSCAICTEIVRETWSKPGEEMQMAKIMIVSVLGRFLQQLGGKRDRKPVFRAISSCCAYHTSAQNKGGGKHNGDSDDERKDGRGPLLLG